MSYPTNPYNLGEAYINPATGLPVLRDLCDYVPTTPCAYVDTRETVIGISEDNMCIPDSCKFYSNIEKIANAPANAQPAPTPPTITAADIYTSNSNARAGIVSSATVGAPAKVINPGQTYYTSLQGSTAIAY
jgi:hypothetical protein